MSLLTLHIMSTLLRPIHKHNHVSVMCQTQMGRDAPGRLCLTFITAKELSNLNCSLFCRGMAGVLQAAC